MMFGVSRRRVVTDAPVQPPGYNFVHNPAVLIEKHTGYRIEMCELQSNKLGRNCLRSAHELTSIEYLLHQARRELLSLAEKIRSNIESGPDEEIETFFPQGEINGSKIGQIDALLAKRDIQIKHLKGEVGTLLAMDPPLKDRVEARFPDLKAA